MQRLAVLGATGSIGGSTLDVVGRHPRRFAVHALTANRDVDRLAELAARFRPAVAVVADGERTADLRTALARAGAGGVAARGGAEALVEVASDTAVDTVVAGIVGAAGLPSTLAAAESGKRLLLANKESLVVAGALVMDAVARSGAELVPLDSEHNALFQCLPRGYRPGGATAAGVCRLLLTASGGPFRERPLETFASITPEEACAHPNWSMGRKISVDSATMLNKGLELIEACWLFGVEPDAVEVVIHPQSIVHSLVAYSDGSTLAQLGNPDMRTPIAHALGWPERIDAGVAPLDLFAVARLDFEPPDPQRFPCLGLARRALRAGAGGPAVLNAANEVAVDAFLDGRISFNDIAVVNETALGAFPAPDGADSLESLMALDRRARTAAEAEVARRTGERST